MEAPAEPVLLTTAAGDVAFPRHDGDDLYRRHDQATWVTPQQRLPYAQALGNELGLPTTFA